MARVKFDGGFFSRKFVLTLLSLLLVSGISLLSINYEAIATILPTTIGGILGVLGIYYGANVTEKKLLEKLLEKVSAPAIVSESKDDEEASA